VDVYSTILKEPGGEALATPLRIATREDGRQGRHNTKRECGTYRAKLTSRGGSARRSLKRAHWRRRTRQVLPGRRSRMNGVKKKGKRRSKTEKEVIRKRG
jgi:hypothetical protein